MIRVAMTTGDVEEIEADAFGEAANAAARIGSQTPPGEVWFGAGTFACMHGAEIPWEFVSHFRLKGLPGENAVYRAVPQHRCWLPEPVAAAVKAGRLVRIRRGARPPTLPPDPVILFDDFAPLSAELDDAVATLPVLDPASLWLSAYGIAPIDRGRWSEQGRGLAGWWGGVRQRCRCSRTRSTSPRSTRAARRISCLRMGWRSAGSTRPPGSTSAT